MSLWRWEIQVGNKLVYSGGPVVGGWFTILCNVEVLRIGAARVQIRHLDGPTAGKTC